MLLDHIVMLITLGLVYLLGGQLYTVFYKAHIAKKKLNCYENCRFSRTNIQRVFFLVVDSK